MQEPTTIAECVGTQIMILLFGSDQDAIFADPLDQDAVLGEPLNFICAAQSR